MRGFLFSLSTLLASAAALVGHQAPPPISTVVIATDPDGRPVTDLRADELQIFDDDAPQRLGTLHLAANSPRTVVVFIDDMNIQPADTPLARQTLRQIRDVVLSPDDLVGVVSTGFSSMAQDLRRDPDRVRFNAVTERMMGSADKVTAPIATLPAAAVDRLNYAALVALRTARDVVARLNGRETGLKAVVYLSSGYPVDLAAGDRFARARSAYAQPGGLIDPPLNPGRSRTDDDVVAATTYLAAEARRANAAFYTIDPKGAPVGPDGGSGIRADDFRRYLETQRSALRTLSQTTGGFCVCGENNLAPPLRRIAAETANYYVVTYRPEGPMADRQQHRVRIATTRPGVILRYSSDYLSAPR